jgi:hypothetical protein
MFESSGMQHLSDNVSRNEFQPHYDSGKSVMEYRAAGWNGEGSPKSASKGKERVRASSSQDRGRKSRPTSREPTRGLPAIVNGSEWGRYRGLLLPSKILAPELKEWLQGVFSTFVHIFLPSPWYRVLWRCGREGRLSSFV